MMGYSLPRSRDPAEISIRQLKAIWALSHGLRLDEEQLHHRVAELTGKRSIRALSRQEARRVIEDFLKRQGGGWDPPAWKTAKATRAQLGLIQSLGMRIGWPPVRVLRLARKMYDVDRLADLEVRKASGLIEALKAIQKRHAA